MINFEEKYREREKRREEKDKKNPLMITVILGLFDSLNSPFSSRSLLSTILRSCQANLNLFIYISIVQLA